MKKLRQVLQSNLRLLVVLRETLRAQKATDSDLFRAIAAQAQMTGAILPDNMRLTSKELEVIQRGAFAAVALPAIEESATKLPSKPGDIIMLTPEQLGKHADKLNAPPA